MSIKDLEEAAKKQLESGMANTLSSGEDAISVALTTTQSLPQGSSAERKKILWDTFVNNLKGLSGVEIDLDTLSISGQTIQAKIGVKSISGAYKKIKSKQLDIYPIIRHKMI